MIKIINVLILAFTIWICSACNNSRTIYYTKKIDYPEKDFLAKNVQLIIEATDSIITNELHMKCSITNCDTSDVAFIIESNYHELEGLMELWTSEVFYVINGKQKASYVRLTSEFLAEASKYYVILKTGEKKEFNLSFEFQYLKYKDGALTNEEWTYKNIDFGPYTIKLIYNDFFQLNKKAIKGRVESNEITVTYVKE
jgi:hypothetical protein